MTIADNPEALAGFVRHLGGEIVEAPTFRFEIPLAETRRVIPEINKLGLRCETNQRTHRHRLPTNGNAITVATIELRRQPEKSAYQEERDLMATRLYPLTQARRGISAGDALSSTGVYLPVTREKPEEKERAPTMVATITEELAVGINPENPARRRDYLRTSRH